MNKAQIVFPYFVFIEELNLVKERKKNIDPVIFR